VRAKTCSNVEQTKGIMLGGDVIIYPFSACITGQCSLNLSHTRVNILPWWKRVVFCVCWVYCDIGKQLAE
jgi:hypothetical protein